MSNGDHIYIRKYVLYKLYWTALLTFILIFAFIPTAYEQLVRDDTISANITVFASSQTSLSFLRKFYDKEFGVFPYLTAIINVQDGVSILLSNPCSSIHLNLFVCLMQSCLQFLFLKPTVFHRLSEEYHGMMLVYFADPIGVLKTRLISLVKQPFRKNRQRVAI